MTIYQYLRRLLCVVTLAVPAMVMMGVFLSGMASVEVAEPTLTLLLAASIVCSFIGAGLSVQLVERWVDVELSRVEPAPAQTGIQTEAPRAPASTNIKTDQRWVWKGK